ncbi:MAG: dockerin type I domain-containing protein [Candidatus Poribacteria bacterium]|nr:dockerin type I domain-containing protein [Candidatus Poribacteria bacterium]
MKKTVFLRWLGSTLVLGFASFFSFPATAQNYYPADIGNMWVLESVDGIKRSTYTLEGSETADGEARILLKIKTEEISTGEAETDHYFLTVDRDTIQLHSIILEDAVATLTADFPTPATFFPLQLELGDKWQIVADAEAKLVVGLTIPGKSTTDLEVVGFEDVVTPAGTFQDCAKVQLDLGLTAAGGFLNLDIDQTTYQYFAPDIGPVQYENSDGLVFGLVSSNLLIEPEEPDTTTEQEDTIAEDLTPEPPPEEGVPEPPPEEGTMPEPVPYDVTGDGVVNILDLTFVATRFGESDSDADVTGDGTVNILDLVLIAQNFGN